MSPGRIIANLGAEETPEMSAEAVAPPGPKAATGVELFRALFEQPPFAWLDPGADGAVAWLNTEAAASEAREAGLVLAGAPPEVVRHTHDKAFALRVAEAEGLVPEPLRGCALVLAPEELAAPDAITRIDAHVADWPAWLDGRYTLKPRYGTSARGRVGGRRGHAPDVEVLAGALPRLAARGGALLEPWLEREADLSVQLYLDRDTGVTLLGTLLQRSAASGVVAGHSGGVDARGRVRSGHPLDEKLREAVLPLALAARDAGYHGPCGVDAFVFRGPAGEPVLRPVVELNARFTLGTIVLAAVRRALPFAKAELALKPGRLIQFAFALSPAPERPGVSIVPQAGGAALWLAEEAQTVEAVFGPEQPATGPA